MTCWIRLSRIIKVQGTMSNQRHSDLSYVQGVRSWVRGTFEILIKKKKNSVSQKIFVLNYFYEISFFYNKYIYSNKLAQIFLKLAQRSGRQQGNFQKVFIPKKYFLISFWLLQGDYGFTYLKRFSSFCSIFTPVYRQQRYINPLKYLNHEKKNW